SSASSHRNHPLRFRHLRVQLLDDRRHLLRDAPGDNHEVSLAWRWAEHFRTEASHVEPRGGHRHHLDRATRQAKSERPDRTLARPVHGLIELREDDSLILQQLAEIIRLFERNVFPDGCAHTASIPTAIFSYSGSVC